ncbi:MAG: hypothetical protein ACRDRP_20395, partial [Pseudonocardiaceae bacterium]
QLALADRCGQLVGGGFGAHGPGLSGVGTDHPNVCYYPVVVWTSPTGHTYHRRPPAIIEPLPDPIPRDHPPYPLVIPSDDDWEDTQIWEGPPPEPDPDPPPEPDPHPDDPPF